MTPAPGAGAHRAGPHTPGSALKAAVAAGPSRWATLSVEERERRNDTAPASERCPDATLTPVPQGNAVDRQRKGATHLRLAPWRHNPRADPLPVRVQPPAALSGREARRNRVTSHPRPRPPTAPESQDLSFAATRRPARRATAMTWPAVRLPHGPRPTHRSLSSAGADDPDVLVSLRSAHETELSDTCADSRLTLRPRPSSPPRVAPVATCCRRRAGGQTIERHLTLAPDLHGDTRAEYCSLIWTTRAAYRYSASGPMGGNGQWTTAPQSTRSSSPLRVRNTETPPVPS